LFDQRVVTARDDTAFSGAVAREIMGLRPTGNELRVLSLSAGGQWGAFGAGFLAGWGQNETDPRPEFDLITGVSAGALMAIPAFLGNADESLAYFRGLDNLQVSRGRFPPTILAAPSLRNPAPLERFLAKNITEETVVQLAEREEAGARLLVAATNLDTSYLEVFSIGAIAANDEMSLGDRSLCIREVLLASAAVPAILPPRNINGTLYADGGLRDVIFLQEIELARDILSQQMRGDLEVTAYLIMNTGFLPPAGDVEDRLLAYVGRAFRTLADEVFRDSVISTIEFAQSRENWEVQAILPGVNFAHCGFDEPPETTFDPCFTAALYDTGFKRGMSGTIPWINADKLRDIVRVLGR